MNEKPNLKTYGIVALLVLWTGIFGFGENVKLTMKKIVEIGAKGIPFYTLNSVCEDDEENIYVLDKKNFNVRKFSKDGKELLSFGSKGEGPGSFLSLNRVYFSKKTGIIVTEMMNFASIFTTEGKIIRKINLTRKGGLFFYIKYFEGDIFYGVSQKGVPMPKQVLFDSSGKIVNSDLYSGKGDSVNMPDGSNYSQSTPEIFPKLIFESYKGLAVAGFSDKYELKLVNSQGKVVKIIRSSLQSQSLTGKEKEYFTETFCNIKNFPPEVQKEFVKKIPKTKTYFYTAMPTTKYVFVFRIKDDTTNENPPYPVDVFKITGEYVGRVNVPKIPLLVSDKYLYFEEDDENNEEAPLLLVKYSYELSK